jgi:predicted permease
MRHDLLLGLRHLSRDRAFTWTAGLTLALCFGANAALFSVVHNVLLKPLAVPESDRILLNANSYPKAGAGDIGQSSAPMYFERLRGMNVYSEQAMFDERDQTVDQGGTPALLHVAKVTPSFFRVAEVAPRLGRIFQDSEGEAGNDKKVILSEGQWRTQFGGDPSAIGRDLRIDGEPYTVVGVMPKGFRLLLDDAALYTPLVFTDQQRSDEARHSNNWYHVGRLQPGATLQQAQAQVDAINAANLDRFPQYKELLVNAGFHTVVMRLQEYEVRHVKGILYLLWAGALFVLLIGCVNVANLVLVRARARLREMATRLALGAGRLRVARQLLIETVTLSLLSAAGGLLLGEAALRVLRLLDLENLPRADEGGLDGTVVVYTLAIALALGAVLGLIPVVGALPANLAMVLREEGRGGTVGRGARALRRGLVVSQVAFAYVLLIGAGLLLASFQRVLSLDPGFRGEGVVTASIQLPRTRYEKDDAVRQFSDEALRRLRALPGVTAAGATDTIPFSGNHSDSVIIAEGHQMRPGESVLSPMQVTVTPGYFETMGARLVSGRFFSETDAAKAPSVAVVDQKLARLFWGDRDPIGKRMYLPSNINDLLSVNDKTVFITVVGVIADMKLESLTEREGEVGTYYFPQAQSPSHGLTFALRTEADLDATVGGVRAAVRAMDPELPVFDVASMPQRTGHALAGRRTPMLLAIGFGALAVCLSAIGIYGVLAYLVAQRTREIAIRIALGSSGRAVFALVLREGLVLLAGGFLLGALGLFAVRGALESQLYGVRPGDPLVLAAVGAVLAAVALAACTLPARRATRIDPILALSD